MAIDRRTPAIGVGVHRLDVEHQGRTRSWTVVVPPAGSPGGLVVVLHGRGGSGEGMRALGLEPLAARRGTVLAYPDAVDGSWNDGRAGVASVAHQERVDDVGFVRRLVEITAAETGADPGRVALIGFSNGAMMAHEVACAEPGLVRAVVLVGAAGTDQHPDTCRPDRPVAVTVVAGTADPIVPYAGGTIAADPPGSRGASAPIEATVAAWRRTNRCSGTATDPIPGTPVVTVSHSSIAPPTMPVSPPAPPPAHRTGCAAPVVLHRVDGGRHDWPRLAGFDTTVTADAAVAAAGV